MARYRKIDTRMWGDQKFRALSSPPASGRYLWMFLLTGPHTTNLPGLFRGGEMALAEELGWSLEGFRKVFAELSQEGLVKADWEARVVWIPKAIKYNRPENPNVVKGWRDSWDEVPECSLKTEAYKELDGFMEGLGEAFAKAFREGCGKALGKGLANQEQEQEQEQEKSIGSGGVQKTNGESVALSCPTAPVAVTEETFSLDAATSYVLVETGLAGTSLRNVVHQVIARDFKKQIADPRATAEKMITAWRTYDPLDLPIKFGPEKFFGTGEWRKPDKQWRRGTNGNGTAPQNIDAGYIPESVRRKQVLEERKASGL